MSQHRKFSVAAYVVQLCINYLSIDFLIYTVGSDGQMPLLTITRSSQQTDGPTYLFSIIVAQRFLFE